MKLYEQLSHERESPFLAPDIASAYHNGDKTIIELKASTDQITWAKAFEFV